MVSKLYQRIAIIVFVVLIPTMFYLKNHDGFVGKGISSIDPFSHLPDMLQQNQNVHNDKMLSNEEQQKKQEVEDMENAEELQLEECTIVNPLNRGFIDLRELSSMGNEGKPLGWKARGYDSGVNYTIGICSSPMKQHHDKSEVADELDSSAIGAFYIDPKTNHFVSIGQYSTTPVFRGRKLTLTYENGSYCENLRDENGAKIRRSTLITLTCDRDMMSKAAVSYIGNSNECNYMFEIRSHHVCPTAVKGNNLAAVWIILIIVLAAFVGVSSGSIVYKHMKTRNRVKI